MISKKILASFLVVVLMFSMILVSCKDVKDNEQDDSETGKPEEEISLYSAEAANADQAKFLFDGVEKTFSSFSSSANKNMSEAFSIFASELPENGKGKLVFNQDELGISLDNEFSYGKGLFSVSADIGAEGEKYSGAVWFEDGSLIIDSKEFLKSPVKISAEDLVSLIGQADTYTSYSSDLISYIIDEASEYINTLGAVSIDEKAETMGEEIDAVVTKYSINNENIKDIAVIVMNGYMDSMLSSSMGALTEEEIADIKKDMLEDVNKFFDETKIEANITTYLNKANGCFSKIEADAKITIEGEEGTVKFSMDLGALPSITNPFEIEFSLISPAGYEDSNISLKLSSVKEENDKEIKYTVKLDLDEGGEASVPFKMNVVNSKDGSDMSLSCVLKEGVEEILSFELSKKTESDKSSINAEIAVDDEKAELKIDYNKADGKWKAELKAPENEAISIDGTAKINDNSFEFTADKISVNGMELEIELIISGEKTDEYKPIEFSGKNVAKIGIEEIVSYLTDDGIEFFEQIMGINGDIGDFDYPDNFDYPDDFDGYDDFDFDSYLNGIA